MMSKDGSGDGENDGEWFREVVKKSGGEVRLWAGVMVRP